jgi:beta-xylosidase
MVLRVGGTYYAYASATGWETGPAGLPVLRSTDLRHWTSAGDALPNPPRWTNADLWGPSVIRWRGRYLLFYNALDRASQNHCLAVASAAAPQGPFRPRKRLMCARNGYRGFIDPAPLAVGRRLLLFFSADGPRHHSLGAVTLTAGGLKATGPVHHLVGVSDRWRTLNSRTVEGPWPMRRNGTVYLFYSTGSWDSDYRMSYAKAKRALGPYTDAAPVTMLGGKAQLPAPGGGSVFSDPGGHNWLAFAAWTGSLSYSTGGARTLRVAPLAWTHGRPAVRFNPAQATTSSPTRSLGLVSPGVSRARTASSAVIDTAS